MARTSISVSLCCDLSVVKANCQEFQDYKSRCKVIKLLFRLFIRKRLQLQILWQLKCDAKSSPKTSATLLCLQEQAKCEKYYVDIYFKLTFNPFVSRDDQSVKSNSSNFLNMIEYIIGYTQAKWKLKRSILECRTF